jgi:hypothetical protein
VADFVHFKAQEEEISQGRYPDGAAWWFHLAPSQNAANGNPIAHAVIDEIMYHPPDSNDEYIELFNPTDAAIDLSNAYGGWRLDGAAEYVFPVGTVLLAHARLVIVGFDPYLETSRLDAFTAAYRTRSLVAGVDILGPWQGNLANHGEHLALEKPYTRGQQGDPIAWVVVDEVVYGAVPPWPQGPDGQGEAIQRIGDGPSYSGNDPTNWRGASPTPSAAP